MNPWGPVLPEELVQACKAFALEFSLGPEQEETLPDRGGVVRRMVIHRGEESIIRTDVRSMMNERLIVDLKPMGAVLVLLEIAKRGRAPRRLLALEGDRAGEYSQGAIEAVWGGGLEGMAMHFPGLQLRNEPRPLRLNDVVAFARTVL